MNRPCDDAQQREDREVGRKGEQRGREASRQQAERDRALALDIAR